MSESTGPRKRWLVHAVLLGQVVLVATAVFLVASLRSGMTALYWVLLSAALAMLALSVYVGLGVAGFVVGALRGRIPRVWWPFSRGTLRLMYGPSVLLGRLFGHTREEIQGSFIALHNLLVGSGSVAIGSSGELLVLIPVCLQRTECRRRVSIDVDNCARCGKCQIDDFLRLRDTYGCMLRVCTGGTAARRFIQELRPRAVLAVACERDLTSGIKDVGTLPVVAVANERPNGPCRDTCVDMRAVENGVRQFLTAGTMAHTFEAPHRTV